MNDSEHSKIPQHVAIIMDGNGRWAKQRNKPRIIGHKAGTEAIVKVIRAASNAGVKALSLFAFSSENWARPADEVKHLMGLFLNALQTQIKKLHEHNIRLKIIGDTEAFSKKIQTHIQKAEQLTKNNTGLTLIIAANYGGQWDIIQATKKIALQLAQNQIGPDDINNDLIANHLMLADLPYPDLFIRTSGEKRISNFFLWQLAYTEMYFTDILWPDFDEQAFNDALETYAQRQRRFGKIDL